MITISMTGSLKRKCYSFTKHPLPQSLAEPDTTCYSQASRLEQWRLAMSRELNALLQNKTWSLVPLPLGRTPIGCKWVYRIKRNADRYKARLDAKGFHQCEGLDYLDTFFSPVAKPITIRVVLSPTLPHKWPIKPIGCSKYILNGHLKEEVYVTQSLGFIDPSFPSHVCKLQRSLYGIIGSLAY